MARLWKLPTVTRQTEGHQPGHVQTIPALCSQTVKVSCMKSMGSEGIQYRIAIYKLSADAKFEYEIAVLYNHNIRYCCQAALKLERSTYTEIDLKDLAWPRHLSPHFYLRSATSGGLQNLSVCDHNDNSNCYSTLRTISHLKQHPTDVVLLRPNTTKWRQPRNWKTHCRYTILLMVVLATLRTNDGLSTP